MPLPLFQRSVSYMYGGLFLGCLFCFMDLFIYSFTNTWRRKWQPTPVSLLGKFCGQRSLVGCSPWGCKESGITKQLTLTLHQYYTVLIIISLWSVLKLKSISSPTLSFFKYCIGYSEPFAFPYKLSNKFIEIYKITCWDFDWDYMESIDHVGR